MKKSESHNVKRKIKMMLIMWVVVLLFVGCSHKESESQTTPESTPSVADEPINTPSLTITPTPIETPTETPTPEISKNPTLSFDDLTGKWKCEFTYTRERFVAFTESQAANGNEDAQSALSILKLIDEEELGQVAFSFSFDGFWTEMGLKCDMTNMLKAIEEKLSTEEGLSEYFCEFYKEEYSCDEAEALRRFREEMKEEGVEWKELSDLLISAFKQMYGNLVMDTSTRGMYNLEGDTITIIFDETGSDLELKYDSDLQSLKVVTQNFNMFLNSLDNDLNGDFYEKLRKEGFRKTEEQSASEEYYHPCGREVELGEYKGLVYTKENAEVTEEEIQQSIDKLLEDYPNYIIDEKSNGASVREGDTVNIDYVGKINGVDYDDISAKDVFITIGAGKFVDGIESSLVGKKVGTTVDVNISFPESYWVPEVAGKDVIFTVTLNYIALPKDTIDDAYVEKYVSDMNTVDELRKNIRARLQKEKEAKAEEDLPKTLVNQVISSSKFTIVRQEDIDFFYNAHMAMIREYAERYGVSEEEIYDGLIIHEKTMSYQEYKDKYWEEAEHIVKEYMVLQAIAQKERLSVSVEEYVKGIEEYCSESGDSNKDDLEQKYGKKYIEYSLLMDKAEEVIVKNAVIKETVAIEVSSKSVLINGQKQSLLEALIWLFNYSCNKDMQNTDVKVDYSHGDEGVVNEIITALNNLGVSTTDETAKLTPIISDITSLKKLISKPQEVCAAWLGGLDSPTTVNLGLCLNSELVEFLERVDKTREEGTMEERLLSPCGIDGLSVEVQIDWALDDVNDSVSGWHYNQYWDDPYGMGLGRDKDDHDRFSAWDVVDWALNGPDAIQTYWIMRSVPDDDRWNGIPEDNTPGVKDQLKPNQYEYYNGELHIDLAEHTMYFRARVVVTTKKDSGDGVKYTHYFSEWSDFCSVGMSSAKIEPITEKDLSSPTVSNLRMALQKNGKLPVVIFDLLVPEELASKALCESVRGNPVVVETELRLRGATEWYSINADMDLKSEISVDLDYLRRAEIISEIDDVLDVEIRCRYGCYQEDQGTVVYSPYSEVLTFTE